MRIWLVAGVLALAGCIPPGEQSADGAADYASFCAACHGAGGKGDGPAAAGLAKKPADLTTLSARNGGTFPGTRVMAKIWGYTGTQDSPMPAFAPLLDSPVLRYDGGDGIGTPTPVRLVALAEYLKSIQQ